MDLIRSSPTHSGTNSVNPSADKNQNGTNKVAVASTSAQVSSNRLGTNNSLPPYNHVGAAFPAEGFATSPSTSAQPSSMNTLNRASVSEIPVFNRLGHSSGHSSFGPYPYPSWNRASLLSARKEVNAPLRNIDFPRSNGAAPPLTTRPNEHLPMVPASVPRRSRTDAWVNQPISLRNPSAGNAPHQNSNWLTLHNVTNHATAVTESRIPVPFVLSSHPPRLPPLQNHSPIPNLQSTPLGAPVASVATAKASREERRKKQRKAVELRRGVNQGNIASSRVMSRNPVLGSLHKGDHVISKEEQRRLQNRASVQKCRARQRSRLEEMANERDALAVENPILLRVKKEMNDSGVSDLVAKWDKEAEEMRKSRESDPSKTNIIPGESSRNGDANALFARRYLVQTVRPSLGASTANPGASFATRRDGHSSLAYAMLPGIHNQSHRFNGASAGSEARTPIHTDNSHPLSAMPIRDPSSHRHSDDDAHARHHPYAHPQAHAPAHTHAHAHVHEEAHAHGHLHPHPLSHSSSRLNKALMRGNHFNMTGPIRQQFIEPQGFGAHSHRSLPTAALSPALPSASAALAWNNTSRGVMNIGVGSAQGEFDEVSQVGKRLRMDDSEDDTRGPKRRNTNSM